MDGFPVCFLRKKENIKMACCGLYDVQEPRTLCALCGWVIRVKRSDKKIGCININCKAYIGVYG